MQPNLVRACPRDLWAATRSEGGNDVTHWDLLGPSTQLDRCEKLVKVYLPQRFGLDPARLCGCQIWFSQLAMFGRRATMRGADLAKMMSVSIEVNFFVSIPVSRINLAN